MGVLEYFEKHARLIEREIDRLVPKDIDPSILAEATRHLLKAGGKRLRPCLVMTACEAVGGRATDAVEAAAALELLHNFTLIHDDIMDRDEFRRNVKTVHTLWGEPMAIIAGDALFAKVFEAVAANARRLKLERERVVELLETISGAAFEICRGQALDMPTEGCGEMSEEKYMRMVSMKTGALIEASAKVGGILGRGKPDQVRKLASYGRLIGVAFQMRDDVLGVKGEEEEFGKPVGSDIREGKHTLIVIRALSKASREDRAKLLKAFGKRDASQEEIKAAIEVLDRTGAIDYVEKRARKLITEAKSKLEGLPASKAKEALLELADFVVERKF